MRRKGKPGQSPPITSDGKVLRFKRKPDATVWQCKCGCFAFWLYSDGDIRCVECQEIAESMRGVWAVCQRERTVARIISFLGFRSLKRSQEKK